MAKFTLSTLVLFFLLLPVAWSQGNNPMINVDASLLKGKSRGDVYIAKVNRKTAKKARIEKWMEKKGNTEVYEVVAWQVVSSAKKRPIKQPVKNIAFLPKHEARVWLAKTRQSKEFEVGKVEEWQEGIWFLSDGTILQTTSNGSKIIQRLKKFFLGE